jgi:ubiquinone/menaquinone biosynthesis C-methylase UbiE
MRIFFEIHSDNPREGPGDFASTRRAFSTMIDLPDRPVILDMGCGPGQQTLDLAGLCRGTIHAIDSHQPYLDALAQKAARRQLEDRIILHNEDMAALPFDAEYADIIWSEGSIYNIGFENGLTSWHPLLKPQGYLAATEISWLKGNPPEELKLFWDQAYPGMGSISENLKIIQKAGYRLIDHFVLPESAWWDDYHTHIEKKLGPLREKYAGDSAAAEILDMEQLEIDLYRKYSDYYGYVFYVMQKEALTID